MMKSEKTTLRNVKKKVQAAEVQLHFLSKDYQAQLNAITPGATIGPEGQALAAKLISALHAMDYCAQILQELMMIDKA